MSSRAKLRIRPVAIFQVKIGPVDPTAVVSRMTSQAVAARAALIIYLTDRAAAIAGYDLVPGPQEDVHARDLLLFKGHAGGLDSPVAEIYDQADPL